MIAAACSKQEMALETPSHKASQSFAASFENYKTTFNTETGAVAWAVGDDVKLAWRPDECVSEALTSADIKESGAAVFYAEPAKTDTLFAVYPSSITVDSYKYNDFLKITIPDVQDGQFAHANVSAAKYIDNKFAFQNAGALLKFTVPAGVKKVIISSFSENALVGKINIGFPEGVISYNGVISGTGKSQITVNVEGEGTYYAAVVPGTHKGIYVSMYDAASTLVGEKQTFKDVEISRGQVKLLGTLPETKLTDKYFVKVDGAGTKDGSSWDNAADLAAMKTAYSAGSLDKKNVYLAAGSYLFETQSGFALNTAYNIKFFGGFPADASGEALDGRDIEANKTIFDGNRMGRILIVTKGEYTYDGITFYRAYRSGTIDDGSALILQGCGNQIIRNCTFLNNENAVKNGGAIRLKAASTSTVLMENCFLQGNIAKADGGAILYESGIFISRNNKYYRNQSLMCGDGDVAVVEGGGGAIHVNAALTATFSGDHFYMNKALKASASAVYVGNNTSNNTWAYDLRFTNCVFEGNRADSRGAVRTSGSTGKVYYNACAFVKDTVNTVASAIQANTKIAIHNCTFYQNINRSSSNACNIYYSTDALISNTSIRLGGDSSVGIRATGGLNSAIVNTQIYNGLKGAAIVLTSGKKLYSYGHNILGTAGTTVITDSGSGYSLKDADHTDYTYCYNATTQPWKLDPQYIGNPYWVLKWNAWPAPGKPAGYELCTPARVETAIDAFDTATSMDVKTWLNEIGYLNKDQRGTTRSATAIWPGSYDNSATVTL